MIYCIGKRKAQILLAEWEFFLDEKIVSPSGSSQSGLATGLTFEIILVIRFSDFNIELGRHQSRAIYNFMLFYRFSDQRCRLKGCKVKLQKPCILVYISVKNSVGGSLIIYKPKNGSPIRLNHLANPILQFQPTSQVYNIVIFVTE